MKCVIIAGGKGTRLGLSDIPKPMAPVGGIPVIEHQVRLARRYGYTEIIVLAGHLAEVIIDHLGDGSRFGAQIEYIVEQKALGTGGALNALRGRIDEDLLVFYGDVFVDMNLRALGEFHKGSGRADGTLVVHPNSHPYDSDLVEVDGNGNIAAIHPKPHDQARTYRNLVNAGLYLLSPSILDHIPPDRRSDLDRDIFPALLASGGRLRAYATPEYLKDMGTPERLASVEHDLARGKPARRNLESPQRCIFLDRDGIINTEAGGVTRREDFELRPDIVPALRRINESDYLAVVVTNQPFIAKGLISVGDLDGIHAKMESLLGAEGVYIDPLYYCPHHPERGFPGEIAELKIDCACRKPKPGMIEQAARDLHIDLSASYILGDHLRDTRAGKNAQLRASVLVGQADTAERQASEAAARRASGAAPAAALAYDEHDFDARFESVDEAVRSILEGRL